MLSKVLDCPECKHRFSFEYSGELPNKITCPSCEKTRFKNEFLALIICPECRTKLRMPMGMVYAGDNVCPECNTTLDPKTVFPEDHIEDGVEGAGNPGGPRLLQDG
ncbi:MAG: zinc-ribbon domain-containing protein, partial [Lentisphaeria bacterium]|nr:zinc-ribbon domain-containing protein [Lentisphaeria bacterium]